MKTQIRRGSKRGFLLNEQDLRRLLQSVTEHSEKAAAGGGYTLIIKAVLMGGAVIESSSIEDILAVENAGAKKVMSLEIAAKSSTEQWSIVLRYSDGSIQSYFEPDTTDLSVEGDSRDWAFLAAADIEERIKRTQRIAWAAVGGENPRVIIYLFAAALSLMFLFLALSRDSAYVEFRKLYEAGSLKDPVYALVELERLRGASWFGGGVWIFPLTFLAPFLVVGAAKIVPYVAPSYNFYWGDNIAIYDRRKGLRGIFWTVVVLGVIVSLVAAVIAKKMGL